MTLLEPAILGERWDFISRNVACSRTQWWESQPAQISEISKDTYGVQSRKKHKTEL